MFLKKTILHILKSFCENCVANLQRTLMARKQTVMVIDHTTHNGGCQWPITKDSRLCYDKCTPFQQRIRETKTAKSLTQGGAKLTHQ